VQTMFDHTSRYAHKKPLRLTTPEGREISYMPRRFLPRGDRLPLLTEVRVQQGDRLDLLAARTLGNPTLFWRICDANDAMHPLELTAEVGRVLRVPVPQPER
jgi:nucleoid-associated protein YgaU